uniref:Uncharacterized protein n=1 Tax=Cucumis sativus TaxID=3659 RepID=A0A0A0LBK3_CUCSA
MKMQVIKSSSIRKRPLYFETMTCKGMLKFLSGDQTAGGLCLLHASKGGICIWAASFPGNDASVRPGAMSFLGSFSRGFGVRYTLVDFLRSHDEQISALSWSPDGRYPNQLTNFSPLHDS